MASRIVIIGGGAGGLELATALGRRRRWRRKQGVEVVLVDRNPTHLWKPLLHEVATGAMDSSVDEVSYRALARQHGFQFVIGEFSGLDRGRKRITLSPIHDERGKAVLPERQISYDRLVLGIGSITNDFNTPGVAEHCLFLDSPQQAQHFQKRFLNLLMRTDNERARQLASRVSITIVGGGATGVELSAELMAAVNTVRDYGFPSLSREALQVTLLEAGPRLLPALPERLSQSTRRELEALGIEVRLESPVTEARPGALITKDGRRLESDMMVWAAGVRGPDILAELGLSVTRNQQIRVHETMQALDDPAIYALGDCAACPQGEDGHLVPPRAQSAHQMASQMLHNLRLDLAGKPLRPFRYVDHGSLVTLSHYSAVGTLMGSLSSGSLRVEGRIARLVYVSLYRMHQIAIYGWMRGLLIAFTDRLHRAFRPRLKLH
ncbi:MAG: NAD(P)/FAD-dependent oxidoreductase [Oleiphilaceae bacterium]|nr:NAD(P)/FAD-dependent oxidoreductase [Oleiphilaceae bacterium]